MHDIYALKFSDGRVYVGMTGDISQRILDHKRGHTKSTKNRGIFSVIILENASVEKKRGYEKNIGNLVVEKNKLKIWGRSSVG